MEKKRSKGSFLSLFDWNAKSRKKLVWNNPTLPEVSKQGKENLENLPDSQFYRIKGDENGASPSDIASGDFNCAVSGCSDEGCGSKAPGLVARLMGLDSLPTSEVDDFRRADYLNTPFKPEKSSWDAMESKARKMENRPMKRFQTEMLPPKSAKPIPVTHNRLLSPIKSNGFLPPKSAAHIMEAAAKIIDGSPQPYMRNRMLSSGSSSVPLRILDLKERLEAAQYAPMPRKQADSNNTNRSNCKPSEKSSKSSRDYDKRSSKGKSGSLAMPSKNNVQSRDTLVSNGNRKYTRQKEQNDIKSNQPTRSQKPIINRALPQKTNASRNSNVLIQNNQKQNGMISKGKSASKIDSNKPTARGSSSESSTGIRKATNKSATNVNIPPKRSGSRATDNRKEFPPSKTQSISQKKKYNSRGFHEARSPDHAKSDFESKSIKCNYTTDGSIDQNAFNLNESSDVISFTFTSPLRKSMPESLSSDQVTETRTRFGVDSLGHNDNLHPKKLSLSPTHMIDSDALSVLLEQKLQELTSRLNLPQCTLASEEPSTDLRSSLQDKASSIVNTTDMEQDEMFSDELDRMHNYRYYSSDELVLNTNQQLQTLEVREDPSYSSNNESGNDLDCQHSNADTNFQGPSVSESYMDSEDSTYGSTVYSSMQDEEVSNISQINGSESLENEATSSEQSSSVSTARNMSVTQIIRSPNMVDFKRSGIMELDYVQNILGNAEFMAEEFIMGRTNTVIMPNLFDLLENHSTGTTTYCGEEYSKLDRKVLFDYVSECLESRCEQAFVGSCKSWPRWVTSIQRKNILAEELYKEMLSFRNMEDVMAEELLSNDMSRGYGKWLDFDIEAFEEGLEVEEDIVESLIDELLSDLLVV
ncbi:uncharacterized protein LOC127132454 isoform X2 [Lathyrus oleraceus]|uniref:DUF4378 domain-containing protein n=1 Tax=Pisum sativum TaxID=3888 RepID=A0A9D5AZ87_PEA|nr:uncharacterized protein LOC127132454 isoform X2 [Pisum sativum]KAI5424536.1 hypothetical protein KIW84_030640 [Pisum sativum]